MRQSMTIRLDQDVLRVAKIRAKAQNRTLTNYIETRVRHDIATKPSPTSAVDSREDARVAVFLAEPVTERLLTNLRDGDTPEETASRQEYLDTITGWNRNA